MIEIYGFDPEFYTCPSCINAKKFAEMKGVRYTFKSILKAKGEYDEQVLAELKVKLDREDLTGLTMPQIFDGDRCIGGFTDFRAEVLDGKIF